MPPRPFLGLRPARLLLPLVLMSTPKQRQSLFEAASGRPLYFRDATSTHSGMIRKSGSRFSEKIMPHHKARAPID